MQQLLRTTDPVLLTFVTSLLKDADIPVQVLDQHMSVLEGSIGTLIPRRVMVPEEWVMQAVRILQAAELQHVLSPDVAATRSPT